MIGWKNSWYQRPWPVTWGFGTNETLLAENPDFVADTVQELWDILNNN